MKKICIIGCGYMGLPMLLLLAKSKKYELVGYDKNIEKINLLNKHILPFEEKGMQELFDKAKDIKYVSELTDTGIDIFVVCVPTPVTNEKNCDYKYVESALKDIIAVAKKEVLIIIESTISPGGTQKIIKPILDKELNHYYLAYVSEKAIPGNTIREMCWNDRVIGGVDEKSSELTKEVYETFVMGDIYCTNSTTAEMVKVVENAARDATIAFSNELSKICYDAGISVHEVIELANHHPRISLLQP
jgi:UDP-N-acetyl-D-mannosaminuronic acid dehydrogenase